MLYGRTTLSKFIIEEQRRLEGGADLIALVNDIQTACKYIASAVACGALTGARGSAGSANVHGEDQKPLDLIANDIMLKSCEWGSHLAGMISEEMDAPTPIPPQYPRGRYLLVFDPLDGSWNLDVNVTVGTIFSVLRAPDGVTDPKPADFLQSGTRQVCAGYALYGPAAMIVITLGTGVHGFTLDPEIGAYILTHPNLTIPADTQEFAVNTSNQRFWEPPVKRYVEECIAGRSGVRGKDLNDAQIELGHWLKPGLTGGEVFEKGYALISKFLDKFPREFIGHGIGHGTHEQPRMNRVIKTVIEPNTVVCLEYSYYHEGLRHHTEDEFLIKDSGVEWWTKDCPRDLVVAV